eukprot:RCo007979
MQSSEGSRSRSSGGGEGVQPVVNESQPIGVSLSGGRLFILQPPFASFLISLSLISVSTHFLPFLRGPLWNPPVNLPAPPPSLTSDHCKKDSAFFVVVPLSGDKKK